MGAWHREAGALQDPVMCCGFCHLRKVEIPRSWLLSIPELEKRLFLLPAETVSHPNARQLRAELPVLGPSLSRTGLCPV